MPAAEALAAVLAGTGAPPGAVIGVVGPGVREVVAAGRAAPDGRPVTEHTSFDLASVTKAITTCALHRLAVIGDLSLSDPVERYLPRTACAPGTTLADLLWHRAGLWEWQPLYLAGADPSAALMSLPLRHPPRQGRHYSDLGFMLLGRVVAAVTGTPLGDAVRALVAEPLGLRSLRFGPIAGDVAAGGIGDRVEQQMVRTGEPYPVLFADAGFGWREDVTIGEANDGNAVHAFGGVSGHAGLFGDAADLLTVASSLADPDADELWGADVRAEVFADGPDAGQAMGWRSRPCSHAGRLVRMLWHPGFTGCAVGLVPDHRLAVVMLTNRLLAQEPPLTATLWDRVAEKIGSGRPAGGETNHER